MKNTIRNTFVAANLAFVISAASTAFAGANVDVDLHPLQAHTVSMTDYTAVVYYSIQNNGDYEVVTTIGPNADVEGQTAQHRVTIKPGQSYELNMDTGVTGASAKAIRFTAGNGTLVVASR